MIDLPRISSRDNAKLKYLRSLKERRESNDIFVEGRRLAEEVLRTELDVPLAVIGPDFGACDRRAELLHRLVTRCANVYVVPENMIAQIADTDSPQGILMAVQKPPAARKQIEKLAEGVVVYLHQISNPSNLGALFRTAEAAGCSGVAISSRSADAYSPKAVRASMGSVFRLPIWENAPEEEFLRLMKGNGFRMTVADITGKAYYDVDWSMPRVVIFGSEAHGVPQNLINLADDRVTIPMANRVESLNLAASAAVILFEAARSG